MWQLFEYVLLCFFIVIIGSLSFLSKFFIDGMCVVAFAHASTINGDTFHPFLKMLLMSGWHFVVILSRVFGGKFVISICKFYVLYSDLWCRGLWWGVVIKMSYDA